MSQTILKISTPSLFSFQECMWFLDRGYDDCLHVIKENTFRKALVIENEQVLIEIKDGGNSLNVELLYGKLKKEGYFILEKYITELFDLEQNMVPFYHLLTNYPQLSYMAKSFRGLRLIGIPDLFESLCWSIIGQQINLTFAYKVKRKLTETYGAFITFQGTNYYIFPKPETISKIPHEAFKEMQFSSNKAKYILVIAEAFEKEQVSKEKLMNLPTMEDRVRSLTSIKGIGEWTANYVLMKTFKEPTAVPYGDVGLLKALQNHRIIKDRSELQKIKTLFEAFNGWQSYLVFYFWRSLSYSILEIHKSI